MKGEYYIKPKNGFLFLLILFLLLGATILLPVMFGDSAISLFAIVPGILFLLVLPGFKVIYHNEAIAFTFFGKYAGTDKENGFFWVNPFYLSKKHPLARRFEA